MYRKDVRFDRSDTSFRIVTVIKIFSNNQNFFYSFKEFNSKYDLTLIFRTKKNRNYIERMLYMYVNRYVHGRIAWYKSRSAYTTQRSNHFCLPKRRDHREGKETRDRVFMHRAARENKLNKRVGGEREERLKKTLTTSRSYVRARMTSCLFVWNNYRSSKKRYTNVER